MSEEVKDTRKVSVKYRTLTGLDEPFVLEEEYEGWYETGSYTVFVEERNNPRCDAFIIPTKNVVSIEMFNEE